MISSDNLGVQKLIDQFEKHKKCNTGNISVDGPEISKYGVKTGSNQRNVLSIVEKPLLKAPSKLKWSVCFKEAIYSILLDTNRQV